MTRTTENISRSKLHRPRYVRSSEGSYVPASRTLSSDAFRLTKPVLRRWAPFRDNLTAAAGRCVFSSVCEQEQLTPSFSVWPLSLRHFILSSLKIKYGQTSKIPLTKMFLNGKKCFSQMQTHFVVTK